MPTLKFLPSAVPALSVAVLLSLSFSARLCAQRGDRPGEVQAPPAHLVVPPAPVLAPEEALRSFALPAGFRIELVASEPLIRDPVAMAFDASGRIWVVEMPRYNADYQEDLFDVTGRREQVPPGRVLILEDTDGDGKMDRRTIFLDGLNVPRAVLPMQDGVLVGDPPYLWFCRDLTGDGRADEKILVAEDFGSPHTPYAAPNGLLWGMDNRIHNAAYGAILKPDRDGWRREPVRSRGQWGISQDDFGRIFYNTNSWHLRGDLYPAHYYGPTRPPAPERLPIDVLIAKDQTVWPSRPTPGVNRGYREGFLRPDGTLRAFTAAAAPLIYRGGNFPPEYYGGALVAAPEANLVRHNLLFEKDGLITAEAAHPGYEFLTSSDERFRPVSLYNGPDGALYIVDMYRGILEASTSITTFLRDQIVERGLHEPFYGLGRIYRVVHEDGPRPVRRDLSALSVPELLPLLRDENGWVRDTVHRLLVERREPAAVPALRLWALGHGAADPRLRVRSLWILEGLDSLDEPLLEAALEDPSPKVRREAVRLVESLAFPESSARLLASLARTAADPSPEVRMQTALTLGTFDGERHRDTLRAMLLRHGDQRYLADTILSSFAGAEFTLLQELLAERPRFAPAPWNEGILARLAGMIVESGDAANVERLLAWGAGQDVPNGFRAGLLKGILAATTTRSGGARMIRLDRRPEGLAALAQSEDPAVSALAQSALERFTWQPAAAAPVARLSGDELALAEEGRRHYPICAACHQPDGSGAAGVGPPLRGSGWVTGSADALVRIVLHGKEGMPDFPGMMPFGGLGDQQIAGILTFLRQSWGHDSPPITPETVARVRRETSGRGQPWTEEELRRVGGR